MFIPDVIQKLAFRARQNPGDFHVYRTCFKIWYFQLRENPRGSKIVSDPILDNMGSLAIFDPRGFDALEMPTFESRSV